MCKILSKMLDVCLVEKDVKRAMQVANMGNTFFQMVNIDGEDTKLYLNSQLSQHDIWQARQFWEDALMQGVAEQFDMVPEVQWDELTPDALREAVLRVHNTVYGQLGSISLNMKGAGMEKSEVVSFVTGICRRSQLTEEQVRDRAHDFAQYVSVTVAVLLAFRSNPSCCGTSTRSSRSLSRARGPPRAAHQASLPAPSMPTPPRRSHMARKNGRLPVMILTCYSERKRRGVMFASLSIL